MEKKFKCKDELIYRSKYEYGNQHWTYGIFSHYEYHQDVTFASLGCISLNINDWDILPYEENEHLVGTTHEPQYYLPSDVEEGKAFIGEIVYYGDEKVKILNVREFKPNHNNAAFYTIRNSIGYEFEEFGDGLTYNPLLFNPDSVVFLKKGERIIPLNDETDFDKIGRLISTQFEGIKDSYFMCETSLLRPSGVPYEFCVRFSDFNPNDMEETKKKILCVKNGKVVKYRE